jgi:hypothetical protein
MNRTFRNALCLPALLATGTAYAADAIVTIDTVEATPGSIAQLAVTIDASGLIGAIEFDAVAGGLMFTDVVYDGPLFASGWEGFDDTASTTPTIVAACIFPQDQVTGFQELFTLEVEVPADAVAGSAVAVDFTDAWVTNYDFIEYDVTIVAGAIEIVDDVDTCPADLDDSGQVDVSDLIQLFVNWGTTGDSSADLDNDGIVGVGDLGELFATWGACK